MKTIKNNLLTSAILTLGITFGAMTLAAQAQEKGAERLVNLQARPEAAVSHQGAHSEAAKMSCSQCTDTLVTTHVNTGKAVNPQETKNFMRHDCPTCKTKATVTGVGKAAVESTTHSCAAPQAKAGSCCGTAK